MKRKQFTFYRSFYDSAEEMTDPMERLGLYEAIVRFALDGTEPKGLSAWQRSIFHSIRPNLEASMAKAEQGLKGKRGPSNSSKNNKGEKEKKKKKELEKKKESEYELENECFQAPAFADFWKLYPVKVGKKDAQAVWDTEITDPEEVMKGLRKWVRCSQWVQDKARFVPRAAKFLSRGDYREDPPGYVPTGGTGELGQAELDAIAKLMAEG